MSIEKFDDRCRGCYPALVNMETGQMAGDDSPEMKVVAAVWDATPLEHRIAFHNVCCNNSQKPEDITGAQSFAERLAEALNSASKG